MTEALEAVVAGPDDAAIVSALEDEGVTVRTVAGSVTGDALRAVTIEDARLFVLTDVAQATAIPLVRELSPDVRTVAYASETVPEFVRGQLDLAVDPGVADASLLAEELAGAE